MIDALVWEPVFARVLALNASKSRHKLGCLALAIALIAAVIVIASLVSKLSNSHGERAAPL